jgi:RNA methyltransferase, TrmH family
MTITSHHNQKLKEIRKLRQRRRWRERSARFVAEGEDLLAAAESAGWEALERYSAAGSGLGGIEVEAELLASASGLGSGTRALGVYEERWAPAPLGPLCVYLHGVHDPGNVGTILRSAEAFGADSVVLGPETADPFSPKAVRASMGAVFTVPLVHGAELGALPTPRVALVPGEGVALHELPAGDGEVTLLVGAEREGLPRELIAGADTVAHIATENHSLNATMAATLALYELRIRMARE